MGTAMVTETSKVTAGGGGDGGDDSNCDGDGNGDNINNKTTINYTRQQKKRWQRRRGRRQ
jgi:hypothetical protein